MTRFSIQTAIAAFVVLFVRQALASTTVLGDRSDEWYEAQGRDEDGALRELHVMNYFFVRGMVSNVRPDPAGLRGVALGPFGVNGATRVGGGRSHLVEQRWIPVVTASPFFVDRFAELRAMFEIDYTWGFSANAIQHNQGGGLGAGQINIQTKGAYVAVFPTRDKGELAILLGTQPFLDSIYNPHTTPPFELARSGYKMSMLSTDATGLSVYGEYAGFVGRAAFAPLSVSQPKKALENDPGFAFAYLLASDVAWTVQPGTRLGLSYWHLRDDTEGQAFAVEGLVRAGPSLLGLPNFNGVAPMSILRPTGHMHYLGLNFHHNLRFYTSRFAASGFVLLNLGKYEAQDERSPNQSIAIRGLAANLEGNYNFGKTADDLLSLEMMLTNGDRDPTDGVQRGPFTLNNYGLHAATWSNHKALLLFPFTSAATNMSGGVTDLQNQGYGVAAVLCSASHDLIPYKLNAKIGSAFAVAFADPPDFTDPAAPETSLGDRGRIVGTEVNLELEYRVRYTMTVGLHTAIMFKGSFYRGDRYVAQNPWAAFTTFTWYAL